MAAGKTLTGGAPGDRPGRGPLPIRVAGRRASAIMPRMLGPLHALPDPGTNSQFQARYAAAYVECRTAGIDNFLGYLQLLKDTQ